MPCVVCKTIKSHETVVFEDEDIVAYLEQNAAAIAHITITTKQHYPSIEFAPDYLVAWCFAISNKLSKVLLESLNIQGLNLLIEVGKASSHFTLNLIPRVQNDNLPLTWTPSKAEFSELQRHQALYKKATANKWIFEEKGGKLTVTPNKSKLIKQEEGEPNYLIKHLKRVP